jgi:uncharacterized protein YegJ (DUF2314 family)
MLAFRKVLLPPRMLIDLDPGLTGEERQAASAGGVCVNLTMQGVRGNVLRDRKFFLRYLRAILGGDGVAAVDHLAQRFWSAASLDEELCHDADLDVQSLYVMHNVSKDSSFKVSDSGTPPAPQEEDRRGGTWLHSHGLAEIGFVDFDIINPSPDVTGRASDVLRAIAFSLVEGKVKGSAAAYPLARPNGAVRFVEVGEFLRKAPRSVAELRHGADDGHNSKRVVLCEPGGNLLSRWLGRVKPSRYLSEEMPDEMLVYFTNEASDLMGERARNTYSLLRSLAGELEEFDLPVIVKLGYVVDGGKSTDREHLWFEVHKMEDQRLEATLANDPFGIARMKKGQRQWHDVANLSDWTIFTPAGPINPRSMLPARAIRAHREEFRKVMRASRQNG